MGINKPSPSSSCCFCIGGDQKSDHHIKSNKFFQQAKKGNLSKMKYKDFEIRRNDYMYVIYICACVLVIYMLF